MAAEKSLMELSELAAGKWESKGRAVSRDLLAGKMPTLRLGQNSHSLNLGSFGSSFFLSLL